MSPEENTKGKHFSQEDRVRMETLLNEGFSFNQIAKRLGKHRCSVGREFKNGIVQVKNTNYKKYESEFWEKYSAKQAQETTGTRKVCCYKIDKFSGLAEKIYQMICKDKFSPAVTAERIGNTVCCKTIYNYIERRIVKAKNIDLWLKLRRRAKKTSPKNYKRILGNSIELRPAEVLTRKTFGHLEADLVIGKREQDEVLLTLIERKTRHGFVFKIPNRRAETVLSVLKDFVQNRPWAKSITFDNGSEFALVHTLQIPTYFAHPYSSWERGSNENFNGMLRRFIRKNTAISKYTDTQISQAVEWINNYPRKLLDFNSSARQYCSELHSA